MATYYSSITDEQADLIKQAKVFFIASVEPTLAHGPKGIGPVNLSPRGGVPLHMLSPNRVAFLDYPGSGNETARHSAAGGPVTVMICSFEAEHAAIVRLYGTARVSPLADSSLKELLLQSPYEDLKSPRQVIEIEVESTVTSCGYGVPVMNFVHDRHTSDRG
ncbi:MAG TPA: pyridoxamine 5'-phosphate oxidase family protein, partial [Anaerolineae bacterium]|nr:pyridoxamine 5'-phosphate oxidase family protein [Anaerolineae bacterium]